MIGSNSLTTRFAVNEAQTNQRISSSETEQPQQSLFCSKEPNEIPCHQKTIVVVIAIVWFGAMVRKVAVTQTLVRMTQWDFNTSAMVCGGMTFLNVMTE